MAHILWWVIFPYITGTIMIVGLLYRYAFRQISWAAPSTEIFEKKKLKIGSLLFHWGIIFAFLGHVMGMVIPRGFYDFFGVTANMYHLGAIAAGGIAGLMVVVGAAILFIRKLTVPRVRAHATFAGYFSLAMMLIVAGMGAYMTLVYNTTVIAYEYRDTIGPWFRSLFSFHPQYDLMASAPIIFQIHVVAAFLLFASIPFTNLIHFFTLPVGYPARAPQQYRSRVQYRKSKS